MEKSYVHHNKLDEMLYRDIFLESAILHQYSKRGRLILKDFDPLMKDAFLFLYKIVLELDTADSAYGVESCFQLEILKRLKATRRMGKLRGRTKGSTAESYIALKYVLDSILDYARGKIDMPKLDETWQDYRDLQSQLLHHTLASLDGLGKLHTLLTPAEQEALLAYDQALMTQASRLNGLKQAYTADQQSKLEDMTRQMIDHILPQALNNTNTADKPHPGLTDSTQIDASKGNNTQTNHKQMNAALERVMQGTPPQTDKAISELISGLRPLNDPDPQDEDINSMESVPEIQKTDDTPSEWKSRLKDALESRAAPYLKETFLQNKKRFSGENLQTGEAPLNSATDKNILIHGQPKRNARSVQKGIYKIDSTTENELRRKKTSCFGNDFSQNATSPLSDVALDILKNPQLYMQVQKLRQLEYSLSKAMNTIDFERVINTSADAIDTFLSATETLGIHSESLNALSFDEILSMHKRFKNPNFIKFINKIGRNKLYAKKLQYQKRKQNVIPIENVTQSHHIDWLIDDEYIGLALDIDAFEYDFYDRFLQDSLLTTELVHMQDRRKGPIILCYDGSGSMEGQKIEETQAHILSILEIAKIQKRKLVLIQFASKTEPLFIKEVNPLYVEASDVLDILDTFLCGGTDFETPLKKAAEFIRSDVRGQSDILFITDGQCEISKPFKDQFIRLKEDRKFKLYTIIMHAHTYHDYGDIGDISDDVLDIKGHDVSNWNKETNRKLYTLI